MDKSSRNVVQFIAALTGAILLLMAAWYFQQANNAPEQVVAETQETPVPEPTPEQETAIEKKTSVFSDADVAPISGAPSAVDGTSNPAPDTPPVSTPAEPTAPPGPQPAPENSN